MGRNKFDQGIDPYAVEIIRFKARQLVGQVGFTVADRDDLEQELILDLLRRLPKYNPKRAKRNTFIAHVVEHKIATLIEKQTAVKRDYRRCPCSVNEPIKDEDDCTVERVEMLDQEDYLRRSGVERRPAENLRELAIDVAAVVETLPPSSPSCAGVSSRKPSPRSPATREFRAPPSTSRSKGCGRSSRTLG